VEERNDSGMGSASAMAGSAVTGNRRYAAALRQLAATRPMFHTNMLIVTHKTNIADAFGKTWADIKESESLLFKPESFDTTRTPVLRVEAREWTALAQSRQASR